MRIPRLGVLDIQIKKKPINLRNINPTSEKRDHATADSAMYEILDLLQTGYIHEYKRST